MMNLFVQIIFKNLALPRICLKKHKSLKKIESYNSQAAYELIFNYRATKNNLYASYKKKRKFQNVHLEFFQTWNHFESY